MKSSHYKTPRTLAECEFEVGYPIVQQEKHANPLLVAAACIMAFMFLAWAFK